MATGQWHYPINLHDDSLSGNISANPISRRFRYTQPTATHGGCPAGNPRDTDNGLAVGALPGIPTATRSFR